MSERRSEKRKKQDEQLMGELQNKIDESYRSEWAISIRKAENVQVGNWLRQNEPERYQAILKAIRKQEEA